MMVRLMHLYICRAGSSNAGVLKFNALLEWLQAHIDGVAPPPAEKAAQKPVKAGGDARSGSTGSQSSAAEEKARRQAKLDEAEKRDKARREKAAQAAGGSKVDDAPEAVPEERVGDVPVSYDESGAADPVPEPVPEPDVEVEGTASQPRATIPHEEL